MNKRTVKIFWFTLITITMLGLFSHSNSKVYGAVSGDYEYKNNGDGTATITDYLGDDREVVIPDTLGSLPVVKIGEMAFYNNRLESVVIPDSVTSIGSLAFFSNRLESVVIPDSVTSIGDSAFRNNRLKSIEIPNSVTSIGSMAFHSFGGNPKDLEILGHSGSEAERYANANNHTFINGDGEVSFGTNGNSTWKKSHSTTVNVSGHDTTKSLQYAWSTSTSTPSTGWTNLTNGATVTRPSGSGNYYLHVRGTNLFGEVLNQRSNVFRIDNTNPTLSLVQSPSGHTNGNVTVTVTGSDSHSGVNYIRQSGVSTQYSGSSKTFTITSNGTYTFRVYDNVGNVGSKSITINNIDKTAPTISLSKNGGDWATSHSTEVSAIDSGSGINKVEYRWTTSSSFPTSGFTTTSLGATLSAPNSTGNHYLHVKATDKVNNVRQLTSNVFRIDRTVPTHVSNSIVGHRYKDSTDYWVKPNDEVVVTFRQRDEHSGNERGYIRLIGSGEEVRYSHLFSGSSTNKSVVSSYGNTSSLEVLGAMRTEHNTSTGYGTIEWTVKPKTDGHNYAVHYYHRDSAGNNLGYTSVARLRVDGTAPTTPTIQAPTSWQNQNVNVSIIGGTDAGSGVAKTEYRIDSGSWTTYSGALTITPNGTTTVQARTFDNVGNVSSTVSRTVKVDKVKPSLAITPSTTSTTSTTHEDVVLTATGSDAHSGVKRIQKPDSTWVTGSTTTFNAKTNGTYEFVVEDNAGNTYTESITINNIDKSVSFKNPTITAFSDVTLKNNNAVQTNVSGITIADWRDNAGFQLNVSASQLKLVSESYHLPAGTLRLAPLQSTTKIDGNDNIPTKGYTSTQAIDDGSINLVNGENSRGEYELAFPDNALEITFDGSIAKTGTYESTITWELVTAP